MSYLWIKIENVSLDTSLHLDSPSSAASLSLWFCDFGFHSGACWVTRIPILHPGGIGADIIGDGERNCGIPRDKLKTGGIFSGTSLCKEVTAIEMNARVA